MDRRQFLLFVSGVSVSALGLEGCGGGNGGSGGGSLQTTRGKVTLPSGSSLSPVQLSINNSVASQPLAADGSFTAKTDPAAPVLVMLRHTSGRAVMFGFVDPASTSNVLDATSQAVTLLYFALGGYGIPIEHKRDVLSLIRKDPATAPLAAVIAARIAADPFALENGDAQIGAALRTAYSAIVAEAPASREVPGGRSATRAAQAITVSLPSSPAMPVSRAAMTGASRASVIPLEILIDQTGPQSGVEVVQDTSNTNIIGVLATNHWRRRCQVLLYRTGDADMNDVRTNYPVAQLVGVPVDLASTSRLGLSTVLTGLFTGSAPFAPVSTNTLPLTLSSGAGKTFYDVVVLGAVNNSDPEPAFFSDPIFAKEVAAWRATRADLNTQALLKDLFFGLALEMLGFGGAIPLDSQVQAAYAAITASTDAPVRVLLQGASSTGGIGTATLDLLKLAAASDSVGAGLRFHLSGLLKIAADQAALQASQGLSLQMLGLTVKMLLNVLNVAQLALGAGDIVSLLHDLNQAHGGDLWTLTLLQPTVGITPKTPTLKGGAGQSFSVTLPPGVKGTIVYDWSTTALIGVLSDGNGKTGRSFETSSATVNLQTTPSDVSPLTVAVTVYQKGAGGVKTKIGDATATVTLTTQNPTTSSTGTHLNSFGFTSVSGNGLMGYTVYGFYTFPQQAGALQYTLEITRPDGYDFVASLAGSVVDRGGVLVITDTPLSTPVTQLPLNQGLKYVYAPTVDTTGGFFNLGNGLIGFPYSQYTFQGTDPTLLSQKLADALQSAQSLLNAATAKVTII